jgi:nucleotide-binding universal stress UspA family protein
MPGREPPSIMNHDDEAFAQRRRQPMTSYKRILLATDFSVTARKALTEAVRLARRDDADLHIVYVQVVALQGLGTFTDAPLPDYVREMRQLSLGGDQNIDVGYHKSSPHVVRDSSESAGILRYARENGIDLIVLGTHGRGPVAELVLGSVAQTVVRDAPVSVLVVGPQAGSLHLRCILAPVDFSPGSRDALVQAGLLAGRASAQLFALSVVDFVRVAHPEQLDIDERERLTRAELLQFLVAAALPVLAQPLVTVGPAADHIIRMAREHDAGLIVMGASGHTPLQRLVLGSVCKDVIRGAPCPVLVHREPPEPAEQRAAA